MRAALALCAAAALVGCRDAPPPDPMTEPAISLVPKAGGAPLVITQGDLRAAQARLRYQREETLYAKPLPKALRDHVESSLVEARVLAAEAERLGVRASTTAVAREVASVAAAYGAEELQHQLANHYQAPADLEAAIRTRLVTQALLEKAAYADIEVPGSALRADFEALADDERLAPAQVRAAQILLPTEEEAKGAKKALDRGADFQSLARRVSIAPEGPRGGDLGWFGRGDMPDVFEKMCFALEVGEISVVTPSEFGYHLCTVLERRPERPRTFDELKARLRADRLDAARREAKQAFLQSLMARYDLVRPTDRSSP